MPKSRPAKPAAKPKKSQPAKGARSAPTPKPAGKGAKVIAPAKPARAEKVSTPPAAKSVAKPHGLNGDSKHAARGVKETYFTAGDDKKAAAADAKLTPFLRKQKERLVHLRDNMLDSMTGVAKDTLRSRAEGSEASAFGMHQADAGSDAYDRDFALSLLSQEQDALYEIEEAIKRIDLGTYGNCEMSGKPIAHARLEAIPFTRYTVECQSQLEKQNKVSRSRVPVTSLFGLTEGEEGAESEEEEAPTDTKE
jgi:DnaK suppressor protein